MVNVAVRIGGSIRLLTLALALLATVPGVSAAQRLGPTPCEVAITEAERGGGLPAGLLGAVARAESGRFDPLAGRVVPWPWAINALGAGTYPATKEEALAAVRALLARGVTLVDVGCMQINLRHHPEAFASLEDAFDPRVNAAYAARFLRDLRARHGDWATAVAHYHSADPDRGQGYLRRVGYFPAVPGAPATASRAVPAAPTAPPAPFAAARPFGASPPPFRAAPFGAFAAPR